MSHTTSHTPEAKGHHQKLCYFASFHFSSVFYTLTSRCETERELLQCSSMLFERVRKDISTLSPQREISHLDLQVLNLVRNIARRRDLGLRARGLARSLRRSGVLGQLPDEGQELGLARDVLAQDLGNAETVLGLVVLENAAKAALGCSKGGVLETDLLDRSMLGQTGFIYSPERARIPSWWQSASWCHTGSPAHGSGSPCS